MVTRCQPTCPRSASSTEDEALAVAVTSVPAASEALDPRTGVTPDPRSATPTSTMALGLERPGPTALRRHHMLGVCTDTIVPR
jgi:hypothetical protein